MMKHTNFILSIIALVLLLSACSSNTLISGKTTDQTAVPNTEQGTGKNSEQAITDVPKQALCIYKKEKGIAEVTAVNKDTYQFKFYLGDDIFELNKGDVVSEAELNIGDEFKAVKETAITKTERHDCLPIGFYLIPASLVTTTLDHQE